MNKDKHVMPEIKDTLADRVQREAWEQENSDKVRTIAGPNNEIISRVKVNKKKSR